MSLLCSALGQDIRHVRDLYRADSFLNERSPRRRCQDPIWKRSPLADVSRLSGGGPGDRSEHIIRADRAEGSCDGDVDSERVVPEWLATFRVSVDRGHADDRHALRMALDMNLHKALDKMADGTDTRTEVEERDLGESGMWAGLIASGICEDLDELLSQ